MRNEIKQIFMKAIDSVKPDSLIKSFISFNGNELIVKTSVSEKRVNLSNRKIYIVGAGKAVLRMCEEFVTQLDIRNKTSSQAIRIDSGILSVPFGSRADESILAKYNISFKFGAKNNIPDNNSEQNTKEIIKLIENAKQSVNENSDLHNPLIISFISGGGSALLSLAKPPLTIEQKRQIITNLVKSGAPITELNSVRRCLSVVKSGKLAKLALKPPNCVDMIAFIISDIIRDPIELIASGPTVIDTEHVNPGSEALLICSKRNVNIDDETKQIILSENSEVRDQNNVNLESLTNIIIGNNSVALNTATRIASSLGYKVIYLGNDIEGEAKDVAVKLAKMAVEYQLNDDADKYETVCWVCGGETTVLMNESDSECGLGGRCQEMGLAFYHYINSIKCSENIYLLAAGSDGQDGPTPLAGVIVDNVCTTNEHLLNDALECLRTHDSTNFFRKNFAEWLIDLGGNTGTNVMDLFIMIKCFKK